MPINYLRTVLLVLIEPELSMWRARGGAPRKTAIGPAKSALQIARTALVNGRGPDAVPRMGYVSPFTGDTGRRRLK